jgi:ATP-dependent helicase HrpB
MVRSVCAIEPEWLLECFADRIEDCTELRFDSERERVSAWSELRYGQLVIAGSALARLPAEAAALLAEAALARGARHFVPDPELLAQFLHRVHFGHRHDPGIPALDAAVVDATLAALCDGRQSFEELREADLLAHLHARLGGGASRLAALAPTHVRLASGRRLLVHYELDRPPWVASRLQDFFGAEHGPSLLEGRLPLVMHLRAPNGRDVQVTTDLGGFWARHYPQLRQALMRRYPRHAWPEDPRHAAPPAASPLRSPTRRRRR